MNDEKKYLNILFYKYVPIENVCASAAIQRNLCLSLSLRGTIIIAEEGINGNLTGLKMYIDRYMYSLKQDSRFHDMVFKVTECYDHNFKKLVIKEKKEIVAFKNQDVTASHQRGKYITTDDLDECYLSQEDFVIIDVRNAYESDVGKFRNAVTCNIKSFQQFPDELHTFEHLKDKKIITYCTGGIRCEKASAFLVAQGFSNVYQLDGGIINYSSQTKHNFFEGQCFVFDNRGVLEPYSLDDPDKTNQCYKCCLPSDTAYTCKKCSQHFVSCLHCYKVMEGCCSKNCRHHLRIKSSSSDLYHL